MQMHLTFPLLSPLFLFLFLLLISPSLTAPISQDLVLSSCVHARYPNLCLRTLSPYKGPATTPKDLAEAALKISLANTRNLSHYLNITLSLQVSVISGSKRLRGALSDCVHQISESLEDLTRTLKELQHLRVKTFEWQMSNSLTWVSAALTNGDTCVDGLKGVNWNLKWEVRRRITNVARLTSNALYLINRLGDSPRTRNPPSKP